MGSRRLFLAGALVFVALASLLVTGILLKSMAFGVMAAAAIVGGIVLFVEPFVGLVLYILFLYIRPQDYMPGLQGMPIMLMIGGVTVVVMFLRMAVRERAIHITPAPQNMLLLWFFAAIIASCAARLYLPQLTEQITRFLPTVIMYFMITTLATSEGKLKFIVNLIVILTLTLATQGVVQYFTGSGMGGQEMYEGRIQAVGIFSDPNDLAVALVIVLPFVFLKVVEPSRLWEKMFGALSLALLVYALYLTASRGGLIAFALLMMLLFLRRFGVVAGALAGAVVMVAVIALGPRMASISTGEASAYGRIEAWGLGIDLFESYPLLGVGAGNFTEYHFRTAHNSVVLAAAELGLAGLFPWVMMIYLSIRNSRFVAMHARDAGLGSMSIYMDTVRYGLIAYAIAAYFLSRTYSELLFILVALTAAMTNLHVRRSGERFVLVDRKDYLYGFLCMLGGYLMTKLFLFTAW